MKRIIFSTTISMIVLCICYVFGFFTYFFTGENQDAFVGLMLITTIFGSTGLLTNYLLDKYWIMYTQTLDFIVSAKQAEPINYISSNSDGSPSITMVPAITAYEYTISFSRKDSPEEQFVKTVPREIYEKFSEGNIVKVRKIRTAVYTHYHVVRE